MSVVTCAMVLLHMCVAAPDSLSEAALQRCSLLPHLIVGLAGRVLVAKALQLDLRLPEEARDLLRHHLDFQLLAAGVVKAGERRLRAIITQRVMQPA